MYVYTGFIFRIIQDCRVNEVRIVWGYIHIYIYMVCICIYRLSDLRDLGGLGFGSCRTTDPVNAMPSLCGANLRRS